jgi:hypothetical protein
MPASAPGARAHRRRRLSDRDPLEAHRSTTPLEQLYDPTVVVAIGTAAKKLAHYGRTTTCALGSSARRSRRSP